MSKESEEKRKCVSINISGDNTSGKTILIKKLLPFLESEGYSCIELDTNLISESGLKKAVQDYDVIIYETVKKEFNVDIPLFLGARHGL